MSRPSRRPRHPGAAAAAAVALLLASVLSGAPCSASAEEAATTTSAAFSPASFTPDFSEVFDEFKAAALQEASEAMEAHLDSVGVGAVISSIVDEQLQTFFGDAKAPLDDMLAYFSDATAADRLAAVSDKLSAELGITLDALSADGDATSTRRMAMALGRREGSLQSDGAIGDVVIATVGLGAVPASQTATYNGQAFTASASAGITFRIATDAATASSLDFAVGAEAHLTFATSDLSPTSNSTTASARQPHTLEDDSAAASEGLWAQLDGSLEATLSLDFKKKKKKKIAASADALSGFAYKVEVSLPQLSAARSLHVYLGHPHWGCAADFPESLLETTVVGWGVTLYAGEVSGLPDAASSIWDTLEAAWGEISGLSGTWDDQWGAATLTIGDTLSVGSGAGDFDFSDAACAAGGDAGTTSEVGLALSEMVDAVTTVTPLILQAEVSAPFCMGDCGSDPLDPLTSVNGSVTLSATEGIDGVALEVSASSVTLGAVVYAATEGLDSTLQTAIRDAVSGISALGLADAALSAQVTPDGVALAVSGSPSLPDSGTSGFQQVLEALDSAALEVSVELEFGSTDADIQISAGTPADTDITKTFAVCDQDGTMGLTLFAELQTTGGTTGDLSLGVDFPVRLCVEGCSGDFTSARYLYLVGSLALEVTETEQLISGELVMDGWWTEAFGVSFVHIGDVVLGLGADLKAMSITQVQLGGQVCLGEEAACMEKAEGSTYVEGLMYVGLDTTDPGNNYFAAMVSKVTVGDAFSIVGISTSGIPAKVLESGIYPYDDTADCSGSSSTPAEIDSACYAYFMYNAGDDVELTFQDGTVSIPSGMALSGRLNFFGWEFAVQAAVSDDSFLIEATMDRVSLSIGGTEVLQLGQSLTSSHDVEGGALFRLAAGDATEVKIAGAFSIPILRSYGEVDIYVTDDVFSFEGDIDLFDGALSCTATVKWDWDLTYFSASIADMSFLGGVVEINDIGFAFDAAKSYAEFDAKVTVLCLASISTTVRVAETEIEFEASATALGITTTVTASAEIDTSNFFDSDFDVSISFNADALLDAVGDAVVAAVNAIADVASAAWDGFTTLLSDGYDFVVGAFDDALSGLKDLAGDVLAGIGDVLSDIEDLLESIPGFSDLVAMGEAIFSGDMDGFRDLLAGSDVGSAFGFTEGDKILTHTGYYNQYDCELVFYRWQVCSVYVDCDWEYGDEFPDEDCMEEVASTSKSVQDEGIRMSRRNTAIAASQSGNAGIQKVLSGAASIPKPTSLGLAGVSFKSSTAMPVAASGTVSVQALSNTEDSGVDASATDASMSASLDLSSEDAFSASLDALTAAAGSAASDAVLASQQGVSSDLTDALSGTAYDAGTQFITPVLLGSTMVVLSCSDVSSDDDLASSPPVVAVSDPLCGSTSVELSSVSDVDSDSVECGTYQKQLTWYGYDSLTCGSRSDPMLQVVVVQIAKPVFTSVPSWYIHTTTKLTGSAPSPFVSGQPTYEVGCGQDHLLSYTDAMISSSSTVEVWLRTWSIRTYLEDDCFDTFWGSTAVQMLTVEDTY